MKHYTPKFYRVTSINMMKENSTKVCLTKYNLITTEFLLLAQKWSCLIYTFALTNIKVDVKKRWLYTSTSCCWKIFLAINLFIDSTFTTLTSYSLIKLYILENTYKNFPPAFLFYFAATTPFHIWIIFITAYINICTQDIIYVLNVVIGYSDSLEGISACLL